MKEDHVHLDDRSNPTVTLLVVLGAAVATLALGVIPLAGVITYPLRLFTTFIHEAGHALAALMTFGDVHQLTVFPNTSGVTMTSGGWRLAISSAGYLGTTLFGVAMLLSARKTTSARTALGVTGLVVLVLTTLYAGQASVWPALGGAALGLGLLAGATVSQRATWARVAMVLFGLCSLGGVVSYLWFSGGLLTWVLGLGSAGLLLLAARYTGGDMSKFIAAFLGVQVSLAAVNDVFTLVGLSAFSSTHTDAQNMAHAYGLPPLVWAVGWSALSLLMVGAAVGFLLWEAARARRSGVSA